MADTKLEKVEKLKYKRDAVILAHYYVDEEVQKSADYLGDSYYLSKMAAETSHKTILFCGVTFMAESAKILNPDKTVLIPDYNARCPLATMSTKDEILHMRNAYEDLAVVSYINSSLEIKTLSDTCITSSNAVNIVKNLPNKNIYIIPDFNLAAYIARQLPEKNILLNSGHCYVHSCIKAEEVKKTKTIYPEALVLVHPECTEAVMDMADYIGSTSEIIDYAKKSPAKEFIICTEKGILYKLNERCLDKKFHFVNDKQTCHNMKLITLDKVIDALEYMKPEVKIKQSLGEKASKPLEKMLQLAYNN